MKCALSCRFLLSFVLVNTLYFYPTVLWAAEVQDGTRPGEKVYFEDFNDPATVDTGAGVTPGLDETEILSGVLRQITSTSGTFTADYAVAAEYTFDPTMIEISGGVASLRPDPVWPDLLGYWRMEEAAWSEMPGEVADGSGNGHDGSILGDPQPQANGLIGRSGAFNGNDAINLGQGINVDPNQEFTLSAWFRTSGDAAILAKADGNFSQRQFYIFVVDDRFWGAVGGAQNDGTATGVADGQWHHGVLINRQVGGSFRYTLYLDGVPNGEFASGTATNSADILIGARRANDNNGLAFPMNGDIDEVAILGRALSEAEVVSLYQSGAGRILGLYPSHGPTVVRTLGDYAFNAAEFDSFTAMLGANHEGDVGFQVSSDGVAWQYWDGTAWVPAGPDDINDSATVDSNLPAFDVNPGTIYVRAFLLSDGNERVELSSHALGFRRDPVFSATEILGPVQADLRFTNFAAITSGVDDDHGLTFRFLTEDGITPFDEALLPGNTLGFDATAAAVGIDLTTLDGGEIYVEITYSNALADGLSAEVKDFWVEYKDFEFAPDLRVTASDSVDPAAPRELITYSFLVENIGNGAADYVELTVPLPFNANLNGGGSAAGWSCSLIPTFICTTTSMEAGASATLSLILSSSSVSDGPIQVNATVTAELDSNPANNSDSETTTIAEPPSATLNFYKAAVPSDGTDFSFNLSGPNTNIDFTLDNAMPDDGDGIGDSRIFTDLPAGTYTLTELPTAGWDLQDILCTGSPGVGTLEVPYDDAAEYHFDGTQVEVSNGVARLLPDALTPDLLGYWRFEEAAWDGTTGEVLDNSGNGHNGTAIGDADPVAGGLLGSTATFDGNGDAVNLGQPSGLDLDPRGEFTLAAWFRSTGDGAIMGKAAGNFGQRQFYMFVAGGYLWGAVGGSQNQGLLSGANDGQWHHGVLVNEDAGGGNMRYTLYLDGVAAGDFASGVAVNNADILIGARRDTGNNGLAFPLNGDIDDVSIFDRALSATEVAGLYNGGSGRILSLYPAQHPTVDTAMGFTAANLQTLTSFTETLGAGNSGEIFYQLSTDGDQWQYWDGVEWAQASGIPDFNAAVTVDDHIAEFNIGAAEDLYVRAFLSSDGDSPVVLDGLQVGYNTDGNGGITPTADGVILDFRVSTEVTCRFVNAEQQPQIGNITIELNTDFPNGDDFFYDGTLGTFLLDESLPDDGDGVDDSITFTGISAGTYDLTQTLPMGWNFFDVFCSSNDLTFTHRIDFDDPADYTFDNRSIEVSFGEAILLPDPLRIGLLGYWRMEEGAWAPGSTAADSSGNGFDAVVHGFAGTQTGILGFGGRFHGSDDALIIGQPPALDLQPGSDEFTLSAWFRPFSDGAIISKAGGDFGARQFYLFVSGGRLWSNIGGVQNQVGPSLQTDGFNHAAVVNYNSGGTMRHTVYLNGQVVGDFASGTSTSNLDILIGARRSGGNTSFGFPLNGEIDEVLIHGRALSFEDINDLFNSGNGRVVGNFPTDSPTIFETTPLFNENPPLLIGFREFLGPGHQGQVRYQISSTTTEWSFWNGTQWVSAGPGQYNDAATMHQHVASFNNSGAVYVRAFFLSDGDQAVELEGIELDYVGNNLQDITLNGDTLTLPLAADQDLVCTFTNLFDQSQLSSITIIKNADVADGTDFSFRGDLGNFLLDDAVPDDFDGITESVSAPYLEAGFYTITEDLPAGWQLDQVTCEDVSPPRVFLDDFLDAADYTLDDGAIEVTDGFARLITGGLAVDIQAYWHLEEATWDGTTGEVIDTFGGFHGTAIGDAATVPGGFIGGGGTFDGVGDAVNLAQPSALDFDPSLDEFTLSVWFKTTGNGALIAKADATTGQRQFYLFALNGTLWAAMGGNQNQGTLGGVSDGQWHHAAVVNYDAGGLMRYALYLDGQFDSEFLSGGNLNDSDILLGARRASGNTGTAFELNGELDEAMIFGRALSASEISDLYNNGEGLFFDRYSTTAPDIYRTTGFFDAGLTQAHGFSVDFGPQNQGTAEFQISSSGTTWHYWDGTGWAVATEQGQHNDAATVDANLSTFGPLSGTFFVRTFLISDGSQQVEIDRLRVTYGSGSGGTINPPLLGSSVSLELGVGQDLECTFHNSQMSNP